MAADAAHAMFQHLSDELNTARTQINAPTAAQDTLRAQAAQAIAASEARTAALIQQANAAMGGPGGRDAPRGRAGRSSRRPATATCDGR